MAYFQFQRFLEKESKVVYLELFRAISTFENQQWADNEMSIVCDGLCEDFLGFGDKASCLVLGQTTQQQLEANKGNPTQKIFAAVKIAVLRELEQAYKVYLQ